MCTTGMDIPGQRWKERRQSRMISPLQQPCRIWKWWGFARRRKAFQARAIRFGYMNASHVIVPPLCILVDFLSSLLLCQVSSGVCTETGVSILECSAFLSPRYDDYLGRKQTTAVSPLINLFPIKDHLTVVHGRWKRIMQDRQNGQDRCIIVILLHQCMNDTIRAPPPPPSLSQREMCQISRTCVVCGSVGKSACRAPQGARGQHPCRQQNRLLFRYDGALVKLEPRGSLGSPWS